MSDRDVVLHLNGVTKAFGRGGGRVVAVDDVDLLVHRGETVGLVGESGCGKSTLARVATRLVDVDTGTVVFERTNITQLRGRALRRARARMQIVFQDPRSSLNPRRTVGAIITEPLVEHKVTPRPARRPRVGELLQQVGLSPALASRYPGELSGGQAQRVAVARALAVNPSLLIADEATSALDVSVTAQIINLLVDLKESLGLAYLFISHDLELVRHLSDRIAVMYLGRIVETAPAEQIFTDPLHPYTVALLSASLTLQSGPDDRIVLAGEASTVDSPHRGCPFRDRCPIGPLADPTKRRCVEEQPLLNPATTGHLVACHYPHEANTSPIDVNGTNHHNDSQLPTEVGVGPPSRSNSPN